VPRGSSEEACYKKAVLPLFLDGSVGTEYDSAQDYYSRFPNGWTRIRDYIREPAAEIPGTMILILFGNGVDCQVVLGGSTKIRAMAPLPPDWYHPLFSSSYWVLVPHPEYRQSIQVSWPVSWPVGGILTGYAINHARDLGPRGSDMENQNWSRTG